MMMDLECFGHPCGMFMDKKIDSLLCWIKGLMFVMFVEKHSPLLGPVSPAVEVLDFRALSHLENVWTYDRHDRAHICHFFR